MSFKLFSNKKYMKEEKTNIEKLSISEIISYLNGCSFLIKKYVESSDYYRGKPDNMLSDDEIKIFTEITKKYKMYKEAENKLLIELENRVNELC